MVNLKRIPFKNQPDLVKGRYFFVTFPYGLFYIIGAAMGYNKTQNLFCLYISGGIGILFLLLSLAHAFDYYRGVAVESYFVVIPFTISLFMAIIMTCIWALGTTFVSSGYVAFTAWGAFVFYLYAVAKDFANGKKYRSYQHVYEPVRQTEMPTAPVPDFSSMISNSNTSSALHHRGSSVGNTISDDRK